MLTEQEYALLVDKCRHLPSATGNYVINDFVENMLLTVVDYMMSTKAVENAHNFYKTQRKHEIQNHADLKRLLARFPDDKAGNTAVAQYLTGYRLWTRMHQLRELLAYFEQRGVTNQEALRKWVNTSTYDEFKGQVKGLGPAIYNWLVMRQDVDNIKPDVRVRAFVESVVGRKISDVNDMQLVDLLVKVAKEINVRPLHLDWRIWEYQGTK